MFREFSILPLLLSLLSLWAPPGVHSFCAKFPFGHICRNMDLTGFCMQTSQMIQIRNNEKPVKPYEKLAKLFEKLEDVAKAHKPFAHFGGYKQGEPPCLGVITPPECPPPAPPGYPPPPTTTTTPAPTPEPKEGELPPTTKPPLVCPAPPPACGGATEPACPVCSSKESPPCPQYCDCCDPGYKTEPANGTIFTINDGCELKYLKAPLDKMGGGSIYTIKEGTEAKENPYTLNVTEISVNGSRLHNWLHIKISHSGKAPFGEELGKGNIKMAFIIAHDATSFPVGEFVNSLPCEEHCKCESGNKVGDKTICHQGTPDDHFPCMFDGTRVVTNTGMMVVQAEDDRDGHGFSEIHATWRFAQSANPTNFITELHFKALVVDDYKMYVMLANDSNKNVRLSGMSERRVKKEGVFGFNPQYPILHPTEHTVGAWDFYREEVYTQKDVNCHEPLSAEHFIVEPYPDSGKIIKKVVGDEGKEKEHCYRLNDIYEQNLPVENMQYCFPDKKVTDPATSRSPVKCPGFGRSRVDPWFHDGYGFIKEGKVDTKQIYPWTLFGARTEAYVLRDGAIDENNWQKFSHKPADPKLYWGTEPEYDHNSLDHAECAGKMNQRYGAAHRFQYPTEDQNYDIQQKYGHFCSDGSGRRVLNLPLPIDNWPNTLATLWKFPPVADTSYFDDRCYCPSIPTTPDPRLISPPKLQIQGRRQHAYQMIIAWNCIVPFGIFVSRYYKETFSKVFFLQEYWWYTVHVLCMFSAAMFTFGGIYVMELKRKVPITWYDPNVALHIGMGYAIIIIFFCQTFSGFFRVKDPKKRGYNIFVHWFSGVIEYILAIACMINSAWIRLSGMTCAGVIVLVFLLIFQVMFYASMEVHMRSVDRQLKLNPPRSYLPPPIMRVFHKDAPDSKFRIYVLIAYGMLCLSTSAIQYIGMESNQVGESCFLKSKEWHIAHMITPTMNATSSTMDPLDEMMMNTSAT